MRILRGKSNLEVSSHGFALFVVGLILATFIGGAVRTVLRSDQIHQRVISELRTRFPHLEVELGATEVLLSRGIWPGLGLKLTHLKLTQKTCDRLSFVLDVPLAVLPIKMWSLRTGTPRLGISEIFDGKIHLDYAPCGPSTAETVSVADAKSAPVGAPTEKKWSLPVLDWRGWSRFASGLQLTNFSVTYAKDPTWKISVNQAEAYINDDLALHAQIEVQKSLPFGSLNHAVDVDVQGEDNLLEWLVNADYKEGRILWKGSLETQSQAATSNFEIRQFPLKDVLNELHQIGALDRQIDLKATWLSCLAAWDGSVAKPDEMPVRVKNCKLEGAYGGAELAQAEIFPLQADRLKVPIDVKIQNMQVQPLVEAFDRKVLPAVINRLGVWSGAFRFLNSGSWSLDGHLDNVEVVFSNQSIRGKQALRRIHTRVEKIGGQIAAKMDQMDVPDGQFIGSVEFSLSEDWRNGRFQADIDNLVLSPAIQSLLIGGNWDSLKVRGSGMLIDGELQEWKGAFESSAVKGLGWTVENLRVQSRFSPGVFTVDGEAGLFSVDPTWRYFGLMKDRIWPASDKMAWRQVRGKAEIRQNGGDLKTLTGLESETNRSWRGQGTWTRDRDLKIALNGFSGPRPRQYSIHLEKGLLAIEEAP